jgi:hypothetical protein
MKSKINSKTLRNLLVFMLFMTSQQYACAIENDTIAVQSDCCVDSTAEKKESPYEKLIKEGGSIQKGLFTVRHIKDDWYLEVPDALLGRMLLAVTRFTSTPQGFKMFSGEEVNRSAIYLEQYGEKTIFLREYVQSQYAKPDDRIAISLKQSSADPIVAKFEVIGRNPDTGDQLINVSKFLLTDNKVSGFTSSDRTILSIGGLQSDRTFMDTIKTYPINLEIQALRTYAMNNTAKVPASVTGSVTLVLNTSIVLLPEEPMQPRYSDDDWNVAFEAAGFKNAIVAKDWPENDTTMSLDDARFSVLRYLPSETENAYGPRIVDPRSGEIIEAHICWYHNVMNLVKKWYMTQCGALDKRAQKMDFPDELMGQLIRFVSSHEVGHSLGLRHNMIASQATPVEKLRDKAWVEKYGHTSSIMDYARFNYVAQPEDNISEKGLFPRINDYDKWAIKWGYQYRPEFKDPVKEKKALRAEVTKVLKDNRRLWWNGDEGKGSDPRSQTEDLGDNQMKANAYGMKNLQRVMQNLQKWTAQPDGEYEDLNEMHRAVRAQYQRYVNHVQRYLGGRYTNNAPGQKPYDFLPRELQREAVAWLGKNVLEAPLSLYPD